MVRTKNTASILRAVNTEVSPSSSSDADNLLDDAELQVSSGSMMMTEVVLDGVPNAQNTGDIAKPTRNDNSDENSEAADSGDLQSSDNDDSSEPDPEKRRAAKLLRLRLAAAESKYHKTWKSIDRYLKTYQRDTLTMIAISETQNVRLRNQR
ncbi:hypothetical protein GN958_ATG15518 [Phytophthora infestans]|uniref:Uncharacterized protein n=1 Tax=Phytophthora infestans TaxID=4787 RepID=A0A8S9U414_PHYIN|nr:hypothetical protein GN958_ATG15518 [Phytophthora infestans]